MMSDMKAKHVMLPPTDDPADGGKSSRTSGERMAANPLVVKAKTKKRDITIMKLNFSGKNPNGMQQRADIIVAQTSTHFLDKCKVSTIYGLINDPVNPPIEVPRRALLVFTES